MTAAGKMPASLLAVAAPLAWIDARRPASWLGLASAFAAAWVDDVAAAVAMGALAIVAAIGAVPWQAGRRIGRVWLLERATWPWVGAVAGSVAAMTVSPASHPPLFPAVAGTVVAAVTLCIASLSHITAADAASLTLVIMGGSLAAGLGTGSVAVAAASWGGLALVTAWRLGGHDATTGFEAHLGRSSGDIAGAGIISQSHVRRDLGRIAMATTVAAMAGWLMLDPERVGHAALAGLAWMVSLAAPLTFLGQPAGPSWRGLLESAARTRQRLGPSPGITAPLVYVPFRHAAVLGWPAIVAAAVGGGGPAGPWLCLAVAAGIASVAAVIALVGTMCDRMGASRETAQSLVLALVAAALFIAFSAVPSESPSPSFLPGW